MPLQPNGIVTFLLSDVIAIDELWRWQPENVSNLLVRYRHIIRQVVETHQGYFTNPVGELLCSIFPRPVDALMAAVEIQSRIRSEVQSINGPLEVCLALHTGEAEEHEGEYFGPAFSRVRYILQAGHAGQILVSNSTQALLRPYLPLQFSLIDLGKPRLKDLVEPEQLFQLVAPGLPNNFPPLTDLENQVKYLPLQANRLIGREQTLDELKNLLGQQRLLTLTGPAGTGKTRLAIQLAAEVATQFQQGVYFVSLTSVKQEPELVLSEVTRVLGASQVEQNSSLPLLDKLKYYLGDKNLLLILDNFEHVLQAAPYVADLLANCPNLKMLITSRTLLRLAFEKPFEVPQLELPVLNPLPAPAQLMQCSALALFVQRAQQVQPDFTITAKNAPVLAEICTRLDGLPLALELAAARLKVLSPQEVLHHLNHRFAFLIEGNRDLPQHQQKLRTAIDWSYQLLTFDEQKIFRQLASFVDGFTIEAAESVCNPDGTSTLNLPTVVMSLVDHSLLQPRKVGGERRFRMLETIREYVLECLESNPEEAALLRQTHANYFLKLAEMAEKESRGPNQATWIERLEAEKGNLRLALGWASKSSNSEMLWQFCAWLWRYWYSGSQLQEGSFWLSNTLATQKSQVPPLLQAQVLNGGGSLCYLQQNYKQAQAYYAESLALYQKIGDDKGAANILSNMGMLASHLNDHLHAHDFFKQSLELRLKIKDDWGLAISYNNLGLANLHLGKLTEAIEMMAQSLEQRERLGDAQGIATSLLNLGQAYVKQGDYIKAVDFLLQSIDKHHQLKNPRRTAYCVGELAIVATAIGRHRCACHLFGTEAALRETTTGLPLSELDRLHYADSLAILHKKFGEETFNQLFAKGHQNSLEEALEEVKHELTKLPTSYPDGLTESEVKILCLLAQGLDDDQIAENLTYSRSNVSNTLSKIYDKIGANEKGRNRRITALLYTQKHNLCSSD